jgi:hypothetical protein
MTKHLLLTCFLATTFVVAACSGEKLSSEDEIRKYIENGVEQAEKRSANGVADMVHENYSDSKGMIKAQIRSMLRLYFLRHKNIYLFTKVGDIIFHTETEATVHLHVAMAGSVISDITALSSLKAQIYRFELNLTKDEEWLLQSAKWKRASMGDIR